MFVFLIINHAWPLCSSPGWKYKDLNITEAITLNVCGHNQKAENVQTTWLQLRRETEEMFGEFFLFCFFSTQFQVDLSCYLNSTL